MKLLLPVLTLALLCTSGGARAVDDATVRQCRALLDAAARLACYDGMPLAEQRFGMAPAPGRKDEPEAIRSTVAGHFDGWQTGTVIALANGQSWRVVDEYDAFLPDLDNPPAHIVRGPLGAYFFQIDGDRHSARVVRVK